MEGERGIGDGDGSVVNAILRSSTFSSSFPDCSLKRELNAQLVPREGVVRMTGRCDFVAVLTPK